MLQWRETAFFSSRAWRFLFPIVVLLIIFRSAIFVFWPQSYFDSDQAVYGLMAKHIAEGRAFPVFMYGQPYLLGVESWLAAPVFLIVGASVAALKFPVLLINIAIGLLLVRMFTNEVGLAPSAALVSALFFVLPAPGTAAQFVEAGGGIIEPSLYVVLIWLTRNRPNWCGVVIGVGFLNREFSIYGVAALLVLDAAHRVLFTREGIRRWLKTLRTAAEVWLVVTWIKQYSSAAGPGTSPLDLYQQTPGDNLGNLWNRVCIDAGQLVSGVSAGLTTHLPRLFGMTSERLREYGIDSNATQGVPWGGLLLLGLFAIPIVRIAMTIIRERRWRPEYDACAYLALVGVFSFSAYTMLRCGVIGTMRYELLSVIGATGLAAWYLRIERARAMAILWSALMLAWVAGTTAGHVRLWAEYATHPPAGVKLTVIRQLETEGVRYAYADYWLAYYITFLTNERIIVHSTDLSRIAEYRRIVDEHRAEAVRISRAACPGGREVFTRIYFCPPTP
ncbi:MAG TPA: hypothetical protein VL882_12225 [Vicinamibacterales bacterium]|jgi:hypothetical protein|nr:hypothetical protein [Vicinamibacterales bacterium]